MDAQVTIEGSPDVLLEAPGLFELVAVGTGGRTWRRRTVSGPYQHGEVLVGAVMDSVRLFIVVRCLGSTWAEVDDCRSALFNAVSRLSYRVTVDVEGVRDEWMCQPADIALTSGDSLNKFQAMAGMQEYTLTIPAYPIPERLLTP